jgi:hypothetical protein
MISLNTVRTALLADDPYTAIDRLIRLELDSGRTTSQIFDELNQMLDAARETPGLGEDGEEAIFGALDALQGNCHPDCNYYDRPNVSQSGDGRTSRPANPVPPEAPPWSLPK